jgi:3-oxoacyl-[acyl-carrier-protein] synthase-3
MRTRRIAGPDEQLGDMATASAEAALAASGRTAAEVDLVVLASCSARPSAGVAIRVASRIGARTAAPVDLNAACAGFCYSLTVAADAIRAGSARHVLVIGAERMTDWVDPADLPTAIVFGDGAGAALVGPADEPGIGPVVWGSDGGNADLIHIGPNGCMVMSGQAVFRWATSDVHPVALEACRRAGVKPVDLAAVVPHQANLRIVDAMARKIAAGDAVVARDGVDTGNTSAASIPLALDRLRAEGQVGPGDLALLVGFGAGLTYAAQVVRLP